MLHFASLIMHNLRCIPAYTHQIPTGLVSMPPTTQSLRHPLTRAHHIAPRIKTARRCTAKSFHAANHTIPPPPSHEGSPHCPKDKNRSPLHGEKPLKL
nr:MAG TPA: hypothetical protein [Bacteriophage sp.]